MSEPIEKTVRISATLPTGATTQPSEHEDEWTPRGGITPPSDLDALANLTQVSPIRRSCIAAVVHNTVGLGLRTQIRKGHEEDVGEDDADLLLERLDALARRDAVLHRPNFPRLLEAVKWDQYECGSGYLEVSRDKRTGEIDGLFHAVGKRIRRRTERQGWVMGPRGSDIGGTKTYFYNFGEKVQYDADGAPTNTLVAGKRWTINELIPFQLFTSESRDYGLPPDAQLALDYLGDKLAAEQNVNFFDNSGVPPTVIFVSGRETEDGGTVRIEVGPELAQQIGDTMRGGRKGSRVAIVPVPPGMESEKHDLAVLSERDMGFVEFRRDNRRRTLAAWRLSPVFVADIEDAGKYTAEVERAITKEQVFDPDQNATEDVLNETLIRELSPDLLLDFNELRIKSDEAERESADSLADRGLATRSEVREAHGKGPLPEAEEPDPEKGEVPVGWNAELVPARAAPAPVMFADGQEREPIEKGLRDGLEDELDGAIHEAVMRVREIAGDSEATVAPLIVEKTEEGTVLIREADPAAA